MKFVSWNVNGLRACEGKGFSEVFRQLDADFFCLQETKMQEGQLDLAFEGYQSYWNYAEKKGYSGTAVFTRHQPLSVTYGIGIDEHDHEGRVVTLEMPDFFLVCCYTPNSQDGLKRLDYRMTWEDAFRAYLQRLDAQQAGSGERCSRTRLSTASAIIAAANRNDNGSPGSFHYGAATIRAKAKEVTMTSRPAMTASNARGRILAAVRLPCAMSQACRPSSMPVSP